MPVGDATGAAVGTISEGDLIVPVGTPSRAKRAWWLNPLAAGTDLSPSFLDCIKVRNHRVKDSMVASVITASPDASIQELADLLVGHRVKWLPVVKDGKLVGIVSRADLVNAFTRIPDAVMEAL